jgi:sucrose-6F-phosphate phosphohydrolase
MLSYARSLGHLFFLSRILTHRVPVPMFMCSHGQAHRQCKAKAQPKTAARPVVCAQMLASRSSLRRTFSQRPTFRLRARVEACAMPRPRFCIVSDLDHTMVDHTDEKYESLLEFNRIWSSKFRHDSYLVFSTGRSQQKYEELRTEAPLLTPDLLICSVGTEIYLKTPTGQELDGEWNAELDKGWDRDRIVALVKSDFGDLEPQSDSEQRPHKVSYHLRKGGDGKQAYVQQLREKLKQTGLAVKVVYSGGSDVDVLPECASKGLALQFLQVRSQHAVGISHCSGVLVSTSQCAAATPSTCESSMPFKKFGQRVPDKLIAYELIRPGCPVGHVALACG